MNAGLLIPFEWAEMFDVLDDVSAASLVRAALSYVRTGETPSGLPRDVLPVFLIVKGQIDQAAEEKRKRSERARAAVAARWAKKRKAAAPADTNDTDVYGRIQQNADEYGRIRTYTDVSPVSDKEKTPEPPKPETEAASTVSASADTNDTTVYHGIHAQVREARVTPALIEVPRDENISTDSKQKRKCIKEKIKTALAQFYHRRDTTVWSEAEVRELGKVCDRPDAETEFEVILAAYSNGYGYTRSDILTLLRNWSVEYDRSQRFNSTKKGQNQNGTELKQRYGI